MTAMVMASVLMLIISLTKETTTEERYYYLKELRSQHLSAKKTEAFLPLDVDIESSETVVAYVDLNNDKFTDLIVYVTGEKEIDFFAEIFNYTSGLFEKLPKALFSIDSAYQVRNLLVNSLEPIGKIDFILTVSPKDNPGQHNTMFFRETSKGVFEKHSFEIINSPIAIADLDGDRYVDILFFDEVSELRRIANFKATVNGSEVNITDFELFFDKQRNCIENNRFISKRFDPDGSNAFIDVDADCRNDLLLTSIDENGNKLLEVWQGRVVNSLIKYCLGKEGVIPIDKRLGAFTLGDFNNDGYIDLIFPVLASTSVEVLFNQYTPEFDWTMNYCESHQSDKVIRTIYDFANATSHKTLALPSKGLNDHFYLSPFTSTVLRLGAFLSEPLPGIIAIIESNDKRTYVQLYKAHFKGDEDDDSLNATSSLLFELAESINVPQASFASFFDFDDNGQLDIIIATENEDNKTVAYYNNYQHDSFFVKAQTMLQRGKSFSIEIGTHYRFIATNNDGLRRMDTTWQLIQTTNMALNPPYALAGIGRSNNYIENFQVISTVIDQSGSDTTTFTPIIPNSQMIITKENKDKEKGGPVKWEIDLIVQPMDQMKNLLIVIGVVLGMITVLIIVLHAREIMEDKADEENKFAAWFA